MKFLKKAISLVLVFAMLASFAGMTGYSPASIIAEAASQTFTVGGGLFTVTMPTVLYKSVADGTEQAHSATDTKLEVAGDYIFKVADNPDMRHAFTAADSVTRWQVQWSIGGSAFNGLWGPVSGRTVDRGSALGSWTSDYSYLLYGSAWGGLRGKGGYRDINEVKCRIIYTTDGTTNFNTASSNKYTEVWSIPIEFAPSSPANNISTTKPIDSKSGLNIAEIDMPPTLYYDSTGKIVNTAGNAQLDTILNISVPDTATSCTLQFVKLDTDDDPYKELGTYDVYKGTENGKHNLELDFAGETANDYTGDNPWMLIRFDYTIPTVPNTPYNTPSGSVIDSTYDEANSNSSITSTYLDNTYDVDLPDTVEVTYTQYIACYVTALPYFRAGWQFDGNKYRYGSDRSEAIALRQTADFSKLLATKGIYLYASFKDEANNGGNLSTTSQDGAYSGVFFNAGASANDSNGRTYYFNGGGWSTSGGSSYKTVGAKIFYDSKVTSTLDFSMSYNFYKPTASNTGVYNDLEVFYESIYATNSQISEWNGSSWSTAGTAKATYAEGNATSNTNSTEGAVKFVSGTQPSSGLNNGYTGTLNANYSINFGSSYIKNNPYIRIVDMMWTPEGGDWIGYARMHGMVGWHLDFVSVDRSNAHTIIENAKSKNYVQAEMDADWWADYRHQVLYSYYALGNLTDDDAGNAVYTDVTSWFTNDTVSVNNPKFETVNHSELQKMIRMTPKYERGGITEDPNLVNEGVVYVPGTGFAEAVGSNYFTGADPSGNSYTDGSIAGNGVNNLTDASLYRYSGAYFYTEESWKNFATERYYGLNILEYKNPSWAWITFSYNTQGLRNQSGNVYCYVYLQDALDAACDRLAEAYNNLELRTLGELKMRNDKNPTKDYDGDGVADNVTTGGGAWVSFDKEVTYNGKTYAAGTKVVGYDAIMAYLASLIPTDTFSYYTDVETNSEGIAQKLKKVATPQLVYDTTALEALLSQMQTRFNADQTVVDMGIEFELYIENFLALVEITKRNPVPADSSAWGKIFNYINNTLCGNLKPEGGLTNVNFVTEISRIYELTQAQKDNFQGLIDAYTTAIAANKTAVGQDAINTAVNNFFNALKEAFSSVWVTDAAAQALGVVSNPATFEVYTPNFASNDKTNSIYLPPSVDTLRSQVAQATAANSYVFKDTTWKSLEERQAEIIGWAKMKEEGGLLEKNKVVLTALERAITNAEAAIAEDNVTTTITSHTGATVEWGKYTAQSVAELRFVINQAMNVDDTMDYTKQLQVDKLTFAIYDEWDDTKGLLLTSDTGMAPRTWSYDANGNPTGYADNWGDPIMKGFLYGDRVEEGNGTDEGLKPNAAYYGFLEEEIKGNTIVKFDDAGNVTEVDETYIGTVWTANGDLILNDNGTPVGDRIFKNWSSYMEHYNEAVALVNAKDKTVDQQSAVNDAAKKLYDARNALELMNLYFPNNTEDFETAKGWYNELSAYVQKTDVTRYGWEYAEVTNEVTDEETGEVTTVTTTVFQKSADPLSSVEQSVYIYNGVTAEVEAQIETFRAKYASDSSTEEYDSLEAAQTLYNNIKAALTDTATGELYTVKKTDDETLIAGMKDLTENYIAGDWDGTTYTSTLLNSTQVEALNGKEGMEGLLPAAQKLITPATDATATFGGTLAYATNAIFNYTKNPATNLQFAAAMRKQVVDFLQLQFSLPVVPAANTFYTNAPATLYMFNQEQAGEFIDLIDGFLGNAANWPLIYEVNNLEVAQDTKTNSATYGVYNVNVWPSKTTVSNADGSITNVSSGTGADKKIDDIFAQIGAQSTYYKQILLFTNNYYVDQLDWIIKNMFVEVDGETLILADLNGAADGSTQPYTDSLGNNITINYDVKKTAQGLRWYSEGYGYHTADNGRVYYLYTSNQTVLGSGKGSWFQDSFVTTLQNMLGGTAYTAMQQRLGTKDYTSIGKIQDNAVATTNFTKYHLAQIETNGWSQTRQNNLYQSVNGDQSAISNAAIQIYNSIRNLKLLNAIQAYRDVINAYWALQGKVYTWSNAQTFSPNSGTQGSLGYEVFYNMDEDTFLEKIPQEKTFVEATATSPKYGTVTGAGLAERYELAVYANGETNQYTELNNFYNGVVGTTGTNIFTIDKAALVYSYGDDKIDSLYEKFVSIASQLKLDDFNRKWLDAIVDAFLTGNLDNLQSQDNKELFAGLSGAPAFESTASESGNYYNASFYTTDSLKVFANILLTNNIVKDIYDDGELIPLSVPIDKLNNYKGQYFVTAQQTPADDLVTGTLIPELNSKLVLRAAETDAIDFVLIGNEGEQNGANFAYNNKDLYVEGDEWNAFKTIYEQVVNVELPKCVDGGEYTAAEDQDKVNKFADDLAIALAALKRKADSAAPKVELSVNIDAVKTFYTAAEKVDSQGNTNAQKLTEFDPAGASNPVTGTLFMPKNGGYSLIVYTNEINPRILLQIEDEKQDISATASIAASKNETISVKSQRTSGTVTSLVYGTIDSKGVIANIYNRNLKGNSLNDYKNETQAVSDITKNEAGSSIFAILAPTFDTGKATAAAVYSIEVNDVVPIEGNSGGNQNYANSLVVGNETVEDVTADDTITVYIYYHSSMAAGNDEGIFVNNEGKVALATPAHGATHVPSVLFQGELNYNGAWRNGVMLQRGFDSTVRSWEFMSIIENNSIGGIKNVAYNDPNFVDKNLGSFYYVFDKSTEPEIYNTYKSGKDSTGGLMDYDRATAAKTAMIDKINKMTDSQIADFTNPEKNKSFYVYGAEDAKGEYVNWAQPLNGKVEKGDLVFVHVVDRWGNVVNRIIEITSLDKDVPSVVAPENTSGIVEISETGGSGLKDITVHNGDFSLGDFDYKIDQNQFVENVVDHVAVNCSENMLTLSKLVPGKTYYIGAIDNAGNTSSTGVKASDKGEIQIEITQNETIVETGEDMGFAGNSSTFTINGTDIITLNAGEASSVIDATIEGNVFANRTIRHYITTKDNVTALKTVYQDGTVEEFTAETVTVKDNGDGTLKWLIPRKLAEGAHTYKVYAKVNGEYEKFYAPATITATNRTIRFTYTISGMGRTVLKYSGSNDIKNSTMDSREIPYGAKVSITAEQTSTSSNFYYWMNGQNERIISTSNAYEFTAVTNTNLVAQFTSYESLYEGKKLVIYVNNAKNVIKAFELADGEGYTVPTGPVLPDYTFKGWSMTKAEVLASDKDTIIVEPIYELNASNTVTITEGNYTATGAGTYTAEANQRAVVTISTSAKDGDGKEFLYWIDADTDEIVSYDRTYSFFCVKDTVLTPVYGDASTVQAEPIVRITEVKYNALSGKVSFFAERSVPEEFIILQTGIVVTKTESIGTNEEVFVVGGTSTAAGTSTSTANNGYYSANTAVATGQTVWARAYAIYETADGEILEAYGPVVSYTVD